MGSSCFCEFLEALAAARALLDGGREPTLAALADFAAEFKMMPAAAAQGPTLAEASPAPRRPSLVALGRGPPAGRGAAAAAGPAPVTTPPPRLGAWGKGPNVRPTSRLPVPCRARPCAS